MRTLFFFYQVVIMSRGRPGKRQFIVESCVDLFLNNGYKATSIDRVVEYTGVSKPTVYNHFSDKSELLDGVVKLAVEQLLQNDHQLIEDIEHTLLSQKSVLLMKLMAGEGRKTPDTLKWYQTQYLQYWLERCSVDANIWPWLLNEYLWPAMMDLPENKDKNFIERFNLQGFNL